MPRAEIYKPSRLQALFSAIQESGKTFFVVDTSSYKNVHIAQSIFRSASKKYSVPVRTMVKNGKLYLIRIKPGEEQDGRKWRNTCTAKRAGTVGGDS